MVSILVGNVLNRPHSKESNIVSKMSNIDQNASAIQTLNKAMSTVQVPSKYCSYAQPESRQPCVNAGVHIVSCMYYCWLAGTKQVCVREREMKRLSYHSHACVGNRSSPNCCRRVSSLWGDHVSYQSTLNIIYCDACTSSCFAVRSSLFISKLTILRKSMFILNCINSNEEFGKIRL